MLKRGNRTKYLDWGTNHKITNENNINANSINSNSMFKNKKNTRKIFLSKKAISPLIATVLLIAFAVSIGTLIMNIGKNVIADVGDCTDVKLDIQTINNKPLFCYEKEDNKINMMIKNTGSVDVKYLKLGITTQDFTHEEITLENSALKTGKTITQNIEYSKQESFKAEIIPVITASGKETICLDSALVAETIGPCN